MSEAGYSAYAVLITEELSEERARKRSLEQRGLSVVTSSGTLVTLLFALGALVTEVKGFELDDLPKALLGVAVASFALAGVLGIFTNKTLNYKGPRTEWLKSLTSEAIWTQTTPELAARRSAEARVLSIESYRDRNKLKARTLTAAISFEVAAVALVAVGIGSLFL